MLLSACAAVGLLVKRNGRYYNSPFAKDISSGAKIIASAVW